MSNCEDLDPIREFCGVYFFGILGPLAIGAIHFARLLFARLL